MRIIAGRHRGRRIEAPVFGMDGGAVRPTADRVRESLFNIIAHAPFAGRGQWSLAGARILDAFAGSGALGLEAISRGAGHAVFMDTATAAVAVIRRNAETLGEGDKITVLRADPGNPPTTDAPCALVLMDPPYGSGLAAPALAALAARGWVADGAVCAVEVAADEDVTPPQGFGVADTRRYGAARVVFLVYDEHDPPPEAA